MRTSTAVIVVHSQLRYPHCKPDLYCMSDVAHAFYMPLIKNTVGAFDWFLIWVLHTGPRKFKPSGIGAIRETGYHASCWIRRCCRLDYRTHLHVIQSNAPKLIKLHPPFIYFGQASTFRLRPTKACR